jgi:hypothetical protein
MRGQKDAISNGKKTGYVKALEREATAFALGHIECWVEQFAKSTGIPYSTLTNGISAALGDSGNRTEVLVPKMRRTPPDELEVLQPTVEVARSTRKSKAPVKKGKHKLLAGRLELVREYVKDHTYREAIKHFDLDHSPAGLTYHLNK